MHATAHDAAAPSAGKKKRGRGEDKPLLGKNSVRKGQAKKDEEFGVTRGIDFKGVRTIINYDQPSSVQGYVHRVGRTGECRGGRLGAS